MLFLVLLRALYLNRKNKLYTKTTCKKNSADKPKKEVYIKKMEICKNLAPDPNGFPQFYRKKNRAQLWKSAYHLQNLTWEMFQA